MRIGNFHRRVDVVANALNPRERCIKCGDHPTRIVGVEVRTHAETSETIPSSGCPACGRPPYRTVAIVGVDVTRL